MAASLSVLVDAILLARLLVVRSEPLPFPAARCGVAADAVTTAVHAFYATGRWPLGQVTVGPFLDASGTLPAAETTPIGGRPRRTSLRSP